MWHSRLYVDGHLVWICHKLQKCRNLWSNRLWPLLFLFIKLLKISVAFIIPVDCPITSEQPRPTEFPSRFSHFLMWETAQTIPSLLVKKTTISTHYIHQMHVVFNITILVHNCVYVLHMLFKNAALARKSIYVPRSTSLLALFSLLLPYIFLLVSIVYTNHAVRECYIYTFKCFLIDSFSHLFPSQLPIGPYLQIDYPTCALSPYRGDAHTQMRTARYRAFSPFESPYSGIGPTWDAFGVLNNLSYTTLAPVHAYGRKTFQPIGKYIFVLSPWYFQLNIWNHPSYPDQCVG